MKKQKIVFGIVLLTVLLLSARALSAQGRFEISTGAGLFDGIFIKAKYGQIIPVGLNADLGVVIHRRTNPPEGYITDIVPISGSLVFFCRF